jgi:predicted KAP-like P-loop ATPase
MAIKGNKATEDRIESEEVARLSAPRDFLSDQPKENPKDDLLGWDKIAENIAECVIANAGKRGFAIGICGRWGSGKTTLLNFIKQHLEDKAVLLDYNPWLVPGKNHVRLFYRDLAKRIGRGIPGENAKKIQRITSLISSFADVVVNPLASVIGPLFFILTTVFGGASIMTLIYRPITSWVLPIAFVVFLLLWLIRGLGHSVAKACSRLQKTTRLTMEELKSKLNAEFATLSKPIVVVIDDLDRLAGAEICEIFRLVRNNADLNNVVYLMAYDRAMVRDILKKDFVDAYSGFQDKVICLEYQLPPADQTVLDNYFKAELQRLLNTCPETIDQYWRDDRWGNYFLLYFRRACGDKRGCIRG